MKPTAWLVRYGAGYAALFIDQARAEAFAARAHGTVHALYEEAP